MKILHISAGTRTSRRIQNPLNPEGVESLLGGGLFPVIYSSVTDRPDVVCLHMDRENERSPLPQIRVGGVLAEGDAILMRFDLETGETVDLSEEIAEEMLAKVEFLEPTPKKDVYWSGLGTVVKRKPTASSFARDEIRRIGGKDFLEQCGPDQSDKEDLILHPVVDPRLFPSRRMYRARAGEFVIIAVPNGDFKRGDFLDTLEIIQVDDRGVGPVRMSVDAPSGAPCSPDYLIFSLSGNTGINPSKILKTPARKRIVLSDGRVISNGVTQENVNVYLRGEMQRSDAGTSLALIEPVTSQGPKGHWVELTMPGQLDLTVEKGMELGDALPPPGSEGVKWYALIHQEHPRAAIVLPDPLTRAPEDWPGGGRLLVSSPIDDISTYQGSVWDLLTTLTGEPEQASALVEILVQLDLDRSADDAYTP